MHVFVRLALTFATVLIAALPSFAGAQPAMPAPAATVAVLPHLLITPELLAGLPRRTVTVAQEDGASAMYSGVDLGALLFHNGAPHGTALRGPATPDYVLVTAADGYRALFALAELDPSLTDKIVLLADARDGKPLDAKYGPFQIIVPDEKHHVRWIHNVHEIDVITPP